MEPQTSYHPTFHPGRDFQPHDDGYKPLDDWSAAEVLASFNEFPIRAVQDQKKAAWTSHISNLDELPSRDDPLSADINLASLDSENGDLPTTLHPFLRRSQSAPRTSNKVSGLSNCPGVSGIGGAMVPGQALKSLYEHLDQPNPHHAVSNQAPKPLHEQIDQSSGHRSEPTRRPSQDGSNGAKPSTAKKSGAFKTTFQFVVNEDAKQMRNTVRKHVMKEFRRKERWEQDLKKEDDEEPEPNGSTTNGKRRRKRSHPTSDSDPSPEVMTSASSSDLGEYREARIPGERAVAAPELKRRRIDAASNEQRLQSWGLAGEEDIYELDGPPMHPYLADPMAAIAPSEVDPFSRLKEMSTPATQSLLHHCELDSSRLKSTGR